MASTLRLLLVIAGALSVLCSEVEAAPGGAAATAAPMPIAFSIPAEPLEKALLAFSVAAHVQVLYDSGLVTDQTSTAVEGRLQVAQALEILLRGTSLRVRYITADAITLASSVKPSPEVMVMQPLQIHGGPDPDDRVRYQRFGEALQNRILSALHAQPATRDIPFDAVVRVWLGPDGRVVRSEVQSSVRTGTAAAAIKAVVDGVGSDLPPPADLPQPIVFQFQSRQSY